LGGVASLAAVCGHAEATTSPSEAEQAEMARLAGEFLREQGLAGLSVAFGRNGTLLHAAGYGYADAAGTVAVTPEHLLRIASVSKPITATAVMACVQKGLLKLDSPVFGTRSLLNFPSTEALHGITVDHLLTHTSGAWPNNGSDPMFRDPKLTVDALIAETLAASKPAFPPGEHYAYSNFGYCLLGRVLEKVTGQSYAQAVTHLVLEPCGIRKMQLGGNTRADRREGEVEYVESLPAQAYVMNITRMDAHGGWIATASDLVRFASQLPKVLNGESIRAMTTPGVNPSYARGWLVNKVPNWWHNGSLPGTTSILVHTARGFCWAGLLNGRTKTSGAGLDELMWQLARRVKAWAE
jgi:CubicO group peptidase (beta-lactamase class C family)